MNKMFAPLLCGMLSALVLGCSDTVPVANMLTATPFAPQGHNIYLRGEMNDYAVLSSYLLVQHGEDGYCTLAPLRADWSPYRFKFAAADWAAGSNFGFADPPGVLREGSAPVRLNPNSRFEELRYYPKHDGVYRFCISVDDDGQYWGSVTPARDDELSLIDEIFKRKATSSPLNDADETSLEETEPVDVQ